MKELFPRNYKNHAMEVRNSEFFKVVKAKTRFRMSALPSMIKMLNACQKSKIDTFKKLKAMPVNEWLEKNKFAFTI